MFCQKVLCYVKKYPWLVMHAGCFIAFIVQMSILGRNQFFPSETVSHLEESSLDSIQFPVLFKICIKSALDMEELNKAGYRSIWSYFIGQSKYNKSAFGWAGHTRDGHTNESVKGRAPFV